jgi:glycosyltransferase involved in cell wall biosynthesis
VKILFISPHYRSFLQVQGGGEQRTYLFIKALTMFADVDFLAFHSAAGFDELPINVVYQQDVCDDVKSSKLQKWLPVFKFWDTKALFPVSESRADIVQKIVQETDYDLIVTHYIPRAMEFDLLRYARKLWIDVDDLPEDKFLWMAKSATSRSSRIRYWLLSKIAKIHTKAIVKKIQKATFPNPNVVENCQGVYLPNIPFYSTTCTAADFKRVEKRIFFVGSLGYKPNYMGINYFLENIYPLLLKKQPDTQFYIAGTMDQNDTAFERWTAYPNVHLLGFVDDLQAEYEKSRVVLVPIYNGAGTNIKVVEALQMNRACAVSEFVTRGFSIFFEDKKDYFVAHSNEEYIEILDKLLTDEKLNNQTAENGRKKVQQHFSFAAFAAKVKEIFISIDC